MAKALLDTVIGGLLEEKDGEGKAKFAPLADGKAYEILEEYDLRPYDLVLEITESAYTGDAEQVITTAQGFCPASFALRRCAETSPA